MKTSAPAWRKLRDQALTLLFSSDFLFEPEPCKAEVPSNAFQNEMLGYVVHPGGHRTKVLILGKLQAEGPFYAFQKNYEWLLKKKTSSGALVITIDPYRNEFRFEIANMLRGVYGKQKGKHANLYGAFYLTFRSDLFARMTAFSGWDDSSKPADVTNEEVPDNQQQLTLALENTQPSYAVTYEVFGSVQEMCARYKVPMVLVRGNPVLEPTSRRILSYIRGTADGEGAITFGPFCVAEGNKIVLVKRAPKEVVRG